MAEDEIVVRVPARAKINLYLHVLGRRSDGYHQLDSLIVFTEFGDRIEARRGGDLSLEIAGPFAGPLARSMAAGDDNLVLKAARELAAACGLDSEAALRLEKWLPPASGIGGGSSDAAAALQALNRLWRTEVPLATLEPIGLRLGADVPACLSQPRGLYIGGIGEHIRPAPALPTAALLLVHPGVALETGRVFAGLKQGYSQAARFDAAPETAADLARLLGERRNDLEAPARALVPEIDDVLRALADVPGALLARMSGSGATCFALFAGLEEARAAEAGIREAHPSWWAVATRIDSGEAIVSSVTQSRARPIP